MPRTRRAILLAAAALSAVAALPADAAAQRRPAVRRPAVRTGAAVARPYAYRPYVRTYYASPAFYRFYGGYAGWYGGYGWYPYYGGPYLYGYPYPYAYPYTYAYPYRRYYDYSSAAQIKVQPREAQVFVDGYYVGTADDFDGWMQRLHVAPGGHDLDVYMPGYRTFSQKVLFRPGATIRIDHVMQPLGPGEPAEPRPSPRPRAAPPAARRGPAPARPREAPPRAGADSAEAADAYGALSVRVQPADAEILIDGERWDTSPAGSLTLDLAAGSHRVDVRKEGFRTYSADVTVRRGATASVNVSLSRE
jgi:hypothetical protein